MHHTYLALVFEPVALPGNGNDVGVVQQAIEQRGGQCRVLSKRCIPLAEPVLAIFTTERQRPSAWSASGLYKAFLAQAADSLQGVDAHQLRKASTHWLRHSHGSHALQGREGQSPVPIQVVQNNLGHASVGTTSLYLTTERDERMKAVRGRPVQRHPASTIRAALTVIRLHPPSRRKFECQFMPLSVTSARTGQDQRKPIHAAVPAGRGLTLRSEF